MVVLDVVHEIQKLHDSDLAARWNCKAGKCGSCSMEINGQPKLSCMTRMNEFAEDDIITIQPLKTFPIIKDLSVDRTAFDRIMAVGGYVSVSTGQANEANAIPIRVPVRLGCGRRGRDARRRPPRAAAGGQPYR